MDKNVEQNNLALSTVDSKHFITVIGVDLKQHVANPWDVTCKCGVKIKRKKPLLSDYKLYSCYECTF